MKDIGYKDCTGCNLCVIPCPVWRTTKNLMLSVCGRLNALQTGSLPSEISESIMACLLCGACKPACPVGIDTVGITLDLRRKLAQDNGSQLADKLKSSDLHSSEQYTKPAEYASTVLLPGVELKANDKIFKQVISALENTSDISVILDDGAYIIAALEAGITISQERMEQFIRPLSKTGEIIIAEGLFHQLLRPWLPRARITGIGEAMLRMTEIRKAIKPTDMYVIDTRCYHADYDRLVDFYDKVRQDTGCVMNVDLMRIAIPTGAVCLQNRFDLNNVNPSDQTEWILQDYKIERIVVENLCDLKPFEQVTQIPVLHISEPAITGMQT